MTEPFNRTYAAAKMAELSDEELRDVVGAHREDYVEEALAIAEAELSRRGIEAAPAATVELVKVAAPKRPKVVWLDVYCALLLASAVCAPVVIFVATNVGASILIQMPYWILQGYVGYGLRRRKLWAWQLNWVLIAVPAIYVLSVGSLALVWLAALAAHGFYFARRKHLFKSDALRPKLPSAPKKALPKGRPADASTAKKVL